ncbi:MAG: hypothetical protein OXF05_04590 [Hyphomicrobiales bacterium]|nr:hypothetical protein [Hyphomicrobiales bacterium]MCY4033241.1 hypothetical protein [Hyphomicrobiales bacterium]MCY4038849.1 hypothetical protein [Hyphomicrobiales bacterium]
MKQVCILLSAFLIAGCSNAPSEIGTIQGSYAQHRGKTCEQMEEEYQHAIAKTEVLTDLQTKKVQDEHHAGSMLVYAVPSLGISVVMGLAEFADIDYKHELAKSKGLVVSLEEVMFKDGCEAS